MHPGQYSGRDQQAGPSPINLTITPAGQQLAQQQQQGPDFRAIGFDQGYLDGLAAGRNGQSQQQLVPHVPAPQPLMQQMMPMMQQMMGGGCTGGGCMGMQQPQQLSSEGHMLMGMMHMMSAAQQQQTQQQHQQHGGPGWQEPRGWHGGWRQQPMLQGPPGHGGWHQQPPTQQEMQHQHHGRIEEVQSQAPPAAPPAAPLAPPAHPASGAQHQPVEPQLQPTQPVLQPTQPVVQPPAPIVPGQASPRTQPEKSPRSPIGAKKAVVGRGSLKLPKFGAAKLKHKQAAALNVFAKAAARGSTAIEAAPAPTLGARGSVGAALQQKAEEKAAESNKGKGKSKAPFVPTRLKAKAKPDKPAADKRKPKFGLARSKNAYVAQPVPADDEDGQDDEDAAADELEEEPDADPDSSDPGVLMDDLNPVEVLREQRGPIALGYDRCLHPWCPMVSHSGPHSAEWSGFCCEACKNRFIVYPDRSPKKCHGKFCQGIEYIGEW